MKQQKPTSSSSTRSTSTEYLTYITLAAIALSAPFVLLHDSSTTGENSLYYSLIQHSLSTLSKPITTAKFFTVFNALYSSYALFTNEKSAKRYGYGTDVLALTYCHGLMSCAFGTSLTAICTFFLDEMKTLDAVVVGQVPLALHVCEKILNWDTTYAGVHIGKLSKPSYAFFLAVVLLQMAGVYLNSSWARSVVVGYLTVMGIDMLAAFIHPSSAVKKFNGNECASKPKVQAMHRNVAMVNIQFITFALCLLNEVNTVRAYGYGVASIVVCMAYKRAFLHEEEKVGFNLQEATIWLLVPGIVTGNLLR